MHIASTCVGNLGQVEKRRSCNFFFFFWGGGRGPAAVHFEHENKNGGIQEPRKETNR